MSTEQATLVFIARRQAKFYC